MGQKLYFIFLILILAACSQKREEPDAVKEKAEGQGCLSFLVHSQQSYLAGMETFAEQDKNLSCVIAELRTLRSSFESQEQEMGVLEIQKKWSRKASVTEIDKVLKAKNWFVGGRSNKLSKAELETVINLLTQWKSFLLKTKTVLPIAQRKRGEGDLVYFEQSYRSIEKNLLSFSEHLPAIIEDFDIDLICSDFNHGSHQKWFANRKELFRSLIILINFQEKEINIRKTLKYLLKAIEIERSFKYQFSVNWHDLSSQSRKFIGWLKKPVQAVDHLMKENGYLPYEAFENMSSYLNSEFFSSRLKSKVLYQIFKKFVVKILNPSANSFHDGLSPSHWAELKHLYKEWAWLEKQSEKDEGLYQNLASLVSKRAVENYSSLDSSHLSQNEFTVLFNDFSSGLNGLGLVPKKKERSSYSIFHDADLFSSTSNGDRYISWFELKDLMIQYAQIDMKHNIFSKKMSRKMAQRLFRRFDLNKDGIIVGPESKSLYTHLSGYIHHELGHSRDWIRKNAYFNLVSEKEWPSMYALQFYYNPYTNFNSDIDEKNFIEIIESARNYIIYSGSSH